MREPRQEPAKLQAQLGTVIGSLGALLAAQLLVGVRGHVAAANVALVLVVPVVAGALIGGRLAGVVSAFVAAASFDFFHTRPYGSLKISDGNDIIATLLLGAIGLALGEIGLVLRRARRRLHNDRLQVRGLHRVAELAADAEGSEGLLRSVAAELVRTLGLVDCRFERPPFDSRLPRVERDGTITGHVFRYATGGFELPRGGAELPVTGGGVQVARFVLLPTPGVGVSLEQRLVAVALADQLGVALVHEAV